MKTTPPVDESTYCALLQAMYKYSRLPNLTHRRSDYVRRLKLVQNHIYHKTGRLHPVRRLIDQTSALKSKGPPKQPGTSNITKDSQSPQVEAGDLPQVAPPTAAHSTDPADYNHTVLPTSSGISRRRPKLVIPTLQGQLPPLPTSGRRPPPSDSQSKLQEDSLGPSSQADISPSLPYTPVEQITHTPVLPPEIPRFPRQKTNLRVTLAQQPSSEYNTPILSPDTPQDPSSPLSRPSNTIRPQNVSTHPRPLLRPRQLSYFHSISDSTSGSKVGSALDTTSGVLRTESLASPLILFQPNLPSGLKRAL